MNLVKLLVNLGTSVYQIVAGNIVAKPARRPMLTAAEVQAELAKIRRERDELYYKIEALLNKKR